VVGVAGHHFLHQLLAGLGAVGLLPAGQLVEHVETQRVAQLQELRVGRVVGHAHGVHVHLLQQLHVEQLNGVVEGAAGFGPPAVAVMPFIFTWVPFTKMPRPRLTSMVRKPNRSVV
jgi:hypothetical protein